MLASDGKKYLSAAAPVETVFRLIQSIPSPKAEPFKLWLAKAGCARMQETIDPGLAVARGRKNWQRLGRSKQWIEWQMLGGETKNKLTGYWADHGIKTGDEFAKLTNAIRLEWNGLPAKDRRGHMNEAGNLFIAIISGLVADEHK